MPTQSIKFQIRGIARLFEGLGGLSQVEKEKVQKVRK